VRASPQRLEDALLERLLPGAAVRARDDLTEEREAEVGVVPPRAGLKHLLRLRRARKQLFPARRPQRLPDLTRRLALQAGRVREHAPDRRGVRTLGQVCRQRVVERQLAGLPQLHDPDRRERLRDRADPVLRLRRRLLARLHVGEPERPLPDELAAAEDGRTHRRHPLLVLGGGEPPLELLAQRLRR